MSSYRDAVRDATPPETRHSHGELKHDHAGGSNPHDHGGNGGSVAFSFGTICIVLGALGFLVSSGRRSACSSVLVQAVNQGTCSTVSTIWTLSALGLVVGIALLIVGAILRGKS